MIQLSLTVNLTQPGVISTEGVPRSAWFAGVSFGGCLDFTTL